MAGKRDIAFVAETINTQLKNNLPAKLVVLDTEYNDSITLEGIPDENFFISERTPGLLVWPLCVTLPENTDVLPFTGEARYDIEHHFLTVAIELTANEDADTLKKRAVRTTRGIQEVFLDSFTLNGSVDHILILAKDYGSLISDGNSLLQEAQVKVRVQTSLL